MTVDALLRACWQTSEQEERGFGRGTAILALGNWQLLPVGEAVGVKCAASTTARLFGTCRFLGSAAEFLSVSSACLAVSLEFRIAACRIPMQHVGASPSCRGKTNWTNRSLQYL